MQGHGVLCPKRASRVYTQLRNCEIFEVCKIFEILCPNFTQYTLPILGGVSNGRGGKHYTLYSTHYTFVAETCQFAVAPYNKYVVNYITIPANGELVLDANKLSEFADKVDDAGYLYIRFLTEKEGKLTVE